MKILKFAIPNTISSISALISSLKVELDILHDNGVSDVDTSKTDSNVVELNIGDDTKKSGNSASSAPVNGATDVELDEDGLPWDPRIHSANKKKLARGNTWKLKRGVDSTLVKTVMDELREAMAAIGVPLASDSEENDNTTAPPPPAATSETAPPPPAPAPAPAPEPIYIVEGSGEFTREALIAVNWTEDQIATLPVKAVEVTTHATDITFPELMKQITAAGLSEAIVQAALPEGIQALPLLATRPDLIPGVYAELFPA